LVFTLFNKLIRRNNGPDIEIKAIVAGFPALGLSFEFYDIIRIDHFRAFDEYCHIPPNAPNARIYRRRARDRADGTERLTFD
jgi:hypothetical protein